MPQQKNRVSCHRMKFQPTHACTLWRELGVVLSLFLLQMLVTHTLARVRCRSALYGFHWKGALTSSMQVSMMGLWSSNAVRSSPRGKQALPCHELTRRGQGMAGTLSFSFKGMEGHPKVSKVLERLCSVCLMVYVLFGRAVLAMRLVSSPGLVQAGGRVASMCDASFAKPVCSTPLHARTRPHRS